MMSKEQLFKLAKGNQYRPEILEKVLKLMQILQQFISQPYLRDRLVLKGGTGLNLFQFENLPRLSVDIDLNYIGSPDRAKMLQEKSLINQTIYKILEDNKFEYYRHPDNHAGSKMIWRYQSVLGHKGNLEIDLNYMHRQPLLNIELKAPKYFSENSFLVPVLDIHELAAGKLSALFSRHVSRGFFDAHYLLTKCQLEKHKMQFVA